MQFAVQFIVIARCSGLASEGAQDNASSAAWWLEHGAGKSDAGSAFSGPRTQFFQFLGKWPNHYLTIGVKMWEDTLLLFFFFF